MRECSFDLFVKMNNLKKKFFRKLLIFLSTLFLKKKKVIKSFGDYKLILNLNEYTAWSYYFRNHEYNEVKFIREKFYNNCNAVDVGANIGFYTLLFSSLSPSGKIIAFEPSFKSSVKLEENIKLNNQKNIILHKLALSNSNGSAHLRLTESINEGGNFITKENHNIDKNFQLVNIKKADDILDNKIFYQFIKIDVEGHELDVLRGMTNILKNNVKYLIIETNNSFEEISFFLKTFEFNLIFNTNINSIFGKK